MPAAIDTLLAARIVAIVRVPSAIGVVEACRTLAANGIRAIEITLTVPGAFGLIETLATEFGPDAVVGAGTVLDAAGARSAIDAGAAFLVSPVADPELMAACSAARVTAIPGAFTPTEVHAAWRGGADIVKLFPARLAPPEYLVDLLGPIPDLRLLPTGGIDETGARAYLNSGAVAVGIGSRLANPAAIARGDLDQLAAAARRFRNIAIESDRISGERR